MRLRQLEYFIAICEAGSYTRAAADLYVSQPSLSQQIKALEKELGAPLLDRVPQGVRLTPVGEAFLPAAKRVIRAVDQSLLAVRKVTEGLRGELSVLSVRSVASNVLPPAVTAWHIAHPTSLLHLRDYHHRRLLEDAISSGAGDLAVGPRPKAWLGTIISLGYEEIQLIGAAAAGSSATRADPAAWAAADWVLYDQDHGLTEVVEAFAAKHDFTPRPSARSAQVEAALSLAAGGVGVTLVPANAVPEKWRHLATQAGEGVYRELVVYTRERPSPDALRFIDCLTAADLPLVRFDDLPAGALMC